MLAQHTALRAAFEAVEPIRTRKQTRALVPPDVLDALAETPEENDRQRPTDLPVGRWIRARPGYLNGGTLYALLSFEDYAGHEVLLFSENRTPPAASRTLYRLAAFRYMDTGVIDVAAVPAVARRPNARQRSAKEYIEAAMSGMAFADLVNKEYIYSQREDNTEPLNVDDNELVERVLRQRWRRTRRGIKGRLSLEDKFESKVDRSDPDGCWLWTGAVSSGYGQFRVGRATRPAHRVAFELYRGEIPPGKAVGHTCEHSHCVRPEHLKLIDADDVLTYARAARGGVTAAKSGTGERFGKQS